MAATASASASPWGKPGAWALAAEQEDDQAASPQEAADFPSLASAAAAKPTKKKKAQTLSLAEFTTGKAVTYGAAKPGDRVVLPTGPRERSQEELERARFGGGSRGYGGGGGEESRWGGGRGFGDEPRRGGGVERDIGPSRADEDDDWGAGKRTAATLPPPRGRMFESHSRADDSGSWVANKGLAPSPPPPESRARRGGIDTFVGAADSAESWGRKKEEAVAVGGGRRRLVLQPRTAPLGNGEGSSNSNTKAKGANPFGEARPREEVLAEKGQDWKKIDEELESLKIKDSGAPSDGSGVGRKGLAMAGPAEERTERSWRKPEVVEDAPRLDLSLNYSFSSSSSFFFSFLFFHVGLYAIVKLAW